MAIEFISFSQALINAVREMLSRSEKMLNNVPIEFAANPKLPETATTTSGAGLNTIELGSNVVQENVNENERRGVGDRARQDLEECSNLEFLIIERQF